MNRQSRRSQSKNIFRASAPDAKPLQFSFRYLDTENNKFPVSGCPDEFWTSLFHELKRYGQFTVDQFIDQNNQDGRHTIDFDQTQELDGFSGIGEGEDSAAWQFAVGTKQRGYRVIGYIVEDTFFVVWLDSNHALYPGIG